MGDDNNYMSLINYIILIILAALTIIFATLSIYNIPAPTDGGFFIATFITGGGFGAWSLALCWVDKCGCK